jgi:HEAT repeat protein
LVAAQRQEGLRQTIFQAIPRTHPQVFRRFLRLILEQDLTRFSATIQAANGWFGFHADVSQRRQMEQSLQSVLGFLEQPALAEAALASDDPQQVYLALWAIAFDDALPALAAAEQLLTDVSAERRLIGVWMLGQLQLPEGYLALLPMLADPDLQVVAEAFSHLRQATYQASDLMAVDLFERLEALLERIPQASIAVQGLPWLEERQPLTQTQIIDTLVQVLEERSPRRLIPYLPWMSPHSRV